MGWGVEEMLGEGGESGLVGKRKGRKVPVLNPEMCLSLPGL